LPGASFSLWQWLFIVFFRWAWRTFFWITGGLEVHGIENVPNGPLLVSPNHRSLLDPWLMLAATPRLHRYLAARELHAIPLLGRYMAVMGSSPITRGSSDPEALARVEKWLKVGDSVVVFAEGRISPDDDFLPFQPGVVVMALRTQTPILPVAIIGSNRVLPYRARRLRRHKIVVRFGVPIVPPPLRRGSSIKALVAELMEQLRLEMKRLYSEIPPGGSSHGKG
jgi:1-acyl-sn-glycerol-3-phosphate acyltransferase